MKLENVAASEMGERLKETSKAKPLIVTESKEALNNLPAIYYIIKRV